MVVSAPFGITDPQISADGTTLIFANYSEKDLKPLKRKLMRLSKSYLKTLNIRVLSYMISCS